MMQKQQKYRFIQQYVVNTIQKHGTNKLSKNMEK